MSDVKQYIPIIREHIHRDYKGMYRKAGNPFPYPFLTPGSAQYADVLWDWDSWLSNIALRQILLETGNAEDSREAVAYEQGCVLNFLSFSDYQGWMPISVSRSAEEKYSIADKKPKDMFLHNMHKPVLAQHAAFLVKQAHGDAEWLREKFYFLQTFLNNYRNHHRHRATGLFYWQDDCAIGVDDDPCTFGRPPKSSGSIYLNALMYRELLAMTYLCERLSLNEVGLQFSADAAALKAAVQEHCWDERDGFYYSVDLNLVPHRDEPAFTLHSGQLRDWECLIMRIGVWSGFLALWAGIATPEQAKRVAAEHFRNEKTFNAPFGVRSLSKMEKMYNLKASGNPSTWRGPIWGIANYMTFRGLVRYGFKDEARELAEKTILLFGRDVERFGALHEYYQPENGEPILNRGFQNWNYLVLNMTAWVEGAPTVEEF